MDDAGNLGLTASSNGNGGNRWRLPLEPMRGVTTVNQPVPVSPTTAAQPVVPPLPAPLDTPSPTPPSSPAPAETAVAATEPTTPEPLEFEAPDVTARYVVAQLGELNEHLAGLTELATEQTGASLEKIHGELRRITSMREVDLTEQAAGIFGAVQAGADSLAAFATVVEAVTTDLRRILADSLAAIGGSDGLAAWVAEGAAELTDIREDFAASLARIERDLALLRQKQPQPAPAANLSDDQLTFIVEAVTEAVVTALSPSYTRPAARRR
jgi:hypothetical protein